MKDIKHLYKTLASLENRWKLARSEMHMTRDWRVEAHIRFILIDLVREYRAVQSEIATLVEKK
jgi:hypothetical protein